MIKKLLAQTKSFKVYSTKEIIVGILGTSLKDLADKIDEIINDPILNRLMRELSYENMKGMTASATTGYGASAGYYVVKGSTLITIISKQINDKKIDIKLENKKANPNKSIIDSHNNLISMLSDYIEYFSKKTNLYFIINGQHRFESIKADLNGTIVAPKSKKEINFDYSKLVVETPEGDVYSEDVESLHELKKKLCSADSEYRYHWTEFFTKNQREQIFQDYLRSSQIFVFEIEEAESFQSIMQFVKRSNQSAEWDDFLFDSLSSFSVYSKWFRENCMPETTNEFSSYQELIYGEDSPIVFGKGTFKVAGGGWQYLIATLMNTCYVNPNNLHRFEVKSKPDISKTLFCDDSPFLQSWGEDLLTDISKVMVAIQQIAKQPNSKIFKEVYEKPSFFIYCVFALNYYKKIYRYTNGKEKWQLNLKDDNLYQFVSDLMIIFFKRSSWAAEENTNFWNTVEGVEKIEEWKAKGAFNSKKISHPLRAKDLKDEFQDEWDDIETKCEKNETKDITKSFRRHFIGDLLSWGHDHSCVVNVLNEYFETAFIETQIEMKSPKIPFASIGFVSCTALPKASKLVSSDDDELYNYLNSNEETDRVHSKARARGGASSVKNIKLGNRSINRKQKAVV